MHREDFELERDMLDFLMSKGLDFTKSCVTISYCYNFETSISNSVLENLEYLEPNLKNDEGKVVVGID